MLHKVRGEIGDTVGRRAREHVDEAAVSFGNHTFALCSAAKSWSPAPDLHDLHRVFTEETYKIKAISDHSFKKNPQIKQVTSLCQQSGVVMI